MLPIPKYIVSYRSKRSEFFVTLATVPTLELAEQRLDRLVKKPWVLVVRIIELTLTIDTPTVKVIKEITPLYPKLVEETD